MDDDCDETFWLEDPRDLLARFDIFPRPEDTWERKLNTITRLIIIITIILILAKWKYWLTFLLIGLVLVIFVYLLKHSDHKQYYVQGVDIMEHFNEEKVLQSWRKIFQNLSMNYQ